MGTVHWAVFWWSILVSWWWHCKLGSVKEIFPQIEWSGKWGWGTRAPRQSSLRRVILWINTAQELRRSVLSDCVTLDNLHYPCAAAHLFDTSLPPGRMNSLVLVRCLQTKSVISTIKNPKLIKYTKSGSRSYLEGAWHDTAWELHKHARTLILQH